MESYSEIQYDAQGQAVQVNIYRYQGDEVQLPPQGIVVAAKLNQAASRLKAFAVLINSSGISTKDQKATWDSLNKQIENVDGLISETKRIAREANAQKADKVAEAWKQIRSALKQAKEQDCKAGNNQQSVTAFERGSILLKNLIETLTT